MPIKVELLGGEVEHYLHFDSSATVGEALRAFQEQEGKWWWLLTTKVGDRFCICSFGSLLPYLTGRTPHIVHRIGDCALCGGMDPLLWRETGRLVDEALASEAICSRRLSELPMAELPAVDSQTMSTEEFRRWFFRESKLRACGVTENGALAGVVVLRMRAPEAMPVF